MNKAKLKKIINNVYFIKETVEKSDGFDAWDVEIAGIHILNTQELKEYTSKRRIINVTFLHKAEEEKSKEEVEQSIDLYSIIYGLVHLMTRQHQ